MEHVKVAVLYLYVMFAHVTAAHVKSNLISAKNVK